MFSKKELSEENSLYQVNSTYTDISVETDTYYHSIDSMNPVKLVGILRHGICSKAAAEKKSLTIDSTSLACNGSNYVSVAIKLGGCMSTDRGAFHFAIERSRVGGVRQNPHQYMPFERQIYWEVPRPAIKAIYVEESALFDLVNPKITLGIGYFYTRAVSRIKSYYNFMLKEFEHHIPPADKNYIQEIIRKLEELDNNKQITSLEGENIGKSYEKNIEALLKKHLKLCYQKVILKESITPYDILRYHDQAILVYDFKGNEIGLNQTRKEFQSPGKARDGFYSNCNKREQFSSSVDIDSEESQELNSDDFISTVDIEVSREFNSDRDYLS